MPLPRFLLYFLRNRAAEPLNHLRRLGPSRRFHYSSYARSGREKLTPLPAMQERSANARSWRSYFLPTAVLGGIGGSIFFLHYNDERRAIPKGQVAKSGVCTVTGPIIGGPFSLIDREGRKVTERDLLGDWVLLYFGYTSSPDVGPAEVQKMAKTADVLGTEKNLKILPIFVTIDPQRDNPSQIGAYLKEFNPRILGLTGPVNAVRQMAQEYRVYFKKVDEEGDDYLVESSHSMYLMNPNMEIVRCFGVEYNAEQLAEAIHTEMTKTGTQTIPQH